MDKKNDAPTPRGGPLRSSPVVSLLMCALCTYVGILCVFVALGSRAKVSLLTSFLTAAAFSLLGAYRFFQNFLKLRRPR